MKLNLILSTLFVASVALAIAEGKPTEPAPAETAAAPANAQPEVANTAGNEQAAGDQQLGSLGLKLQNGLKSLISAAGTAQQHFNLAKDVVSKHESTKTIQKDLGDILNQAKIIASDVGKTFSSTEQGAALDKRTREILTRAQQLYNEADNSDAGKRLKSDLKAVGAQALNVVKQAANSAASSNLYNQAASLPSKLTGSLESGTFAQSVDNGLGAAGQYANTGLNFAAEQAKNVAETLAEEFGWFFTTAAPGAASAPEQAPTAAPEPAKAE